MQDTSAVEYLKNVLGNWEAFCDAHQRFEKAIKEVLAENEYLRKQIANQKEKKDAN
jgi:hypothetical protein